MRVIGGSLRGRRLRAPGGEETRPTPDRVREALFSILTPRLEGSRFLDGYAGTGAVGIEALSRGASFAVFVENGLEAGRVLRGNLEALGLDGLSRVVARPFARCVPTFLREGGPFDIVFLDPPYGPREILRALRLCSGPGLVHPRGLLVAQHDRRLALPDREGDLVLARQARYGSTLLSFYRPAGDSPEGGPPDG